MWTQQEHAAPSFETKFLLPHWKVDTLRNMLGAVCRPDPEFPEGRISSVYFDTPDFTLLNEKLNSDYLKTKIRLRTYAHLDRTADSGVVFFEVKLRCGTHRQKFRVPFEMDNAAFREMRLESFSMWELEAVTKRLGIALPGNVRPVLEVSYNRHRFIDSRSGSRLALDERISVTRVNANLFPVQDKFNRVLESPSAVFEVKGSEGRLPLALGALTILELKRSSFSKYAEAHRLLSL